MRLMKKLLFLAVLVALFCGINHTAFAQVDTGLVAKFLDTAKSAQDSQLGAIASELTGKMQALGDSLGVNDAVKKTLDNTLESLTGGRDSEALTHAFDLVKAARFTPEQLGIAKQVGNLASAYVMQKNFATLEGSQNDVATVVSSLRKGPLTAAIAPLKNVAANTHLSDGQKTLVKTVADKYAPGWQKAKDAMDAFKKLPGFGN